MEDDASDFDATDVLEQTLLPNDVLNDRKGKERRGDGSIGGLTRSTKLCFGLIVLLLCGSGAAFLASSAALETIVHQIEAATHMRTKAQQSAAWLEARHLPGIRHRIGIQQTLEAASRDMRGAHAQLTVGALSPSGAHLELYNTPLVPTVQYLEAQGHRFRHVDIKTLFDAGFDLVHYTNKSVMDLGGDGWTQYQVLHLSASEDLAQGVFKIIQNQGGEDPLQAFA